MTKTKADRTRPCEPCGTALPVEQVASWCDPCIELGKARMRGTTGAAWAREHALLLEVVSGQRTTPQQVLDSSIRYAAASEAGPVPTVLADYAIATVA